MKRYEAIKKIREIATDEIILSNIGDPSKELFSVGDRNENFYMLGSMGMVSSIGLGLALANKRQILALDGDGSVAMNLGTLITIAAEAPGNFNLIILDNEAYGSTGYQETTAARICRLHDLAVAAGNKNVYTVTTINQLEEIVRKILFLDKPSIVVVKISREHEEFPIIDLTAETIKIRFMKSIESTKRYKDE